MLAANHDSDGAVELRSKVGSSATDTSSAPLDKTTRGEAALCKTTFCGAISGKFSARGAAMAPSPGAVSCRRGFEPARASDCGIRWPRHCFSSHSTQNVRPRDTGKPHALHFSKFLNSRGTALGSAMSSNRRGAGWSLRGSRPEKPILRGWLGLHLFHFHFFQLRFF